MNRVATALLLGGVALLVSWVVAPAAPTPQPSASAALAAIDQAAPVVADVNAQVDRLRERLASPPQFPPPARDPFRFGLRREPPPPATPVVDTPLVPVEPPPPPLPQLVAIIANMVDGTLVRSAVLSEGEDLQIVKSGDKVGRFVVRAISVDAAELIDNETSRTYSISLK